MAEIVQINATSLQPTPEPTIIQSILDFFLKYWWVFLILILFLVGIIILIVWLMKKLKEQKFPLYRLFCERTDICRQHRDKRHYKAFLKVTKNTPIVCQYLENEGLKRVTIGYYFGDYFSSEGNHNIAFAKKGAKKWLILPVNRILLINQKSHVCITHSYKEKGEIKFRDFETDLPTGIEHFGNEEITLMGCKSVDKLDEEGLFFVPVLAGNDKDKNQLDMSLFAYHSVLDVAKGEELMNSYNYFVTANKRALDINPMIRTIQKTGDTSQSVEENPNK